MNLRLQIHELPVSGEDALEFAIRRVGNRRLRLEVAMGQGQRLR